MNEDMINNPSLFIDGFEDEQLNSSSDESMDKSWFMQERMGEDGIEMVDVSEDSDDVPDWMLSDEELEGMSIDDDGQLTDNVPSLSQWQDIDDEYEIVLGRDDGGMEIKATKASLMEAYNTKERIDAQSRILNDAGKYLIEYENWMQERADSMLFETDNAIRELKGKLASGMLSPVEKAQAYDQLEAYNQRFAMIQNNVKQEKAKREEALSKTNAMKVQNTVMDLTNNYRWSEETLRAVDSYAIQNIPGLNQGMISPQLYVLVKKAMEYDKKNTPAVSTVKKSGSTISSSQRKASRAHETKQALAAKAVARGEMNASDMFQFLVN